MDIHLTIPAWIMCCFYGYLILSIISKIHDIYGRELRFRKTFKELSKKSTMRGLFKQAKNLSVEHKEFELAAEIRELEIKLEKKYNYKN